MIILLMRINLWYYLYIHSILIALYYQGLSLFIKSNVNDLMSVLFDALLIVFDVISSPYVFGNRYLLRSVYHHPKKFPKG